MKRIFFLSLAIIFFITNISYADTLRIPISGVKRETETISKLLQPDADATTKLASNHKIISGEQAYKEFQAEIGKFRTNNITEQYRDSLIRALQYLINVRFSGVDRKQLNREKL